MNYYDLIMSIVEALQIFMIFGLLFKIKVQENRINDLELIRVPVESKQENRNDLLERYRREVQNKKFSV